ncbi:hypothetical protein DTO046C5_3482 [Penicillium roqueforti]|nr:hypothetical protein DTO046C5_3482 [Penicillium roqueforti]
MAEYKISYESQLDVYHPSYRYETHDPRDWQSAAARGPALPALGNATAGAVGAAISNVVVYPLNVIVARLQTQKQKDTNSSEKSEDNKNTDEGYTSVADAARKIYAQEGISGFYPGLAQDTWKTVADSFLFFLAYSALRQKRIVARVGVERAAKSKNIVLPIIDELAVGILAGSFAKLFTTPLSNIVARKQTAAARKGGNAKNLSTSDIAARIRSEKGILGFWSGYSATLILTLNPSLTFFLNEFLKRTFLPRSKRDKPHPALTFLLAALSKVAASSITYPFSLAKTRAQVMSSISKPKSESAEKTRASVLASLTPEILFTVATIARTDGISGLYAGLQGEVLKGFFSHGFTMLVKDAVYAFIIKSYYLLLLLGHRYPSPDELIQRAREQAEEYSEIAREGARDLAERTREGAEELLKAGSGGNAVDMTSNFADAADAARNADSGIDASSGLKDSSAISDELNETAELVGDYVEDEAAEWRTLYHCFLFSEDLSKSKQLIYLAPEHNEEDIAFFHDLINDPIIQTLSTGRLPRPSHKKSARDFISRLQDRILGVVICLPAQKSRAEAGTETDPSLLSSAQTSDAPVQNPNSKPVLTGHLSLSSLTGLDYAHHRNAVIGISTADGYRGKGYGGEAINWALHWAFQHGGLHRVSKGAFSFNHNALRLYRRPGFVDEGREREAIYYRRAWHDTVGLSMLEHGWEVLRIGDMVLDRADRA